MQRLNLIQYGILLTCLNDSGFPFTYRSEVHVGKPSIITEDGYYLEHVYDITKRLLEKYGFEKMKGATLVTDNLYSSLPLLKLVDEKQMNFVGTLRQGCPHQIRVQMTFLSPRDANEANYLVNIIQFSTFWPKLSVFH